MKDLFDINLLSQIQGLDKKMSISKEQTTLRRKVTELRRERETRREERKGQKNTGMAKDRKQLTSDGEEHQAIDITI